jgi:phage terminase large subunit-like protein
MHEIERITPSDRYFLDHEGGTYDPSKGRKVIDFIESFLCLENGEPFKVIPWMQQTIHSWYSWIRADGFRRIKVGLLSCGRKQGKSILTYGLTAYHLIADGALSPSCVSCAVNREQAGQIFDWFKFAIDNNPKLAKALHVTPSKKLITYPKRNGRYRSLASDTGGGNFGHGHDFVIHDELAFHKKDDVYTALKNSTDAKPNGLQLITSTSGWNKNGAFFKLCQYSKKVLSGEVIDTTFQPWLFCLDPEDDYDDESKWIKANPSLGICQSIEDFRNQWQREKHDATTKNSFIRLKFNGWTESENGWIPVESWTVPECNAPVPDTLRTCTIGVDVGITRDLTAITAVFPHDGHYYVKTWGFVPEDVFKSREKSNVQVYESCRSSLTITKGGATDERYICSFLDGLIAKYDVKGIVFDKFQSLVMSNHVERLKIPNFNFGQNHKMFNGPCIELERLVNFKRIHHGGDALLRWQIGHTYLDRDAKGYVKPVTARKENKKDNLIALLMALSQAVQHTGEKWKCPYGERGIIYL